MASDLWVAESNILLVFIKVFRLNGRPYCYSSVSFSLLLFFFILLDVSKTPRRIFMKFSEMVYFGLERPKIIFRVMTSLPVRDIDDFLILRVSFCDAISSETTQDIFFKFSRMIDKGLKFINCEAQVSRSNSAEARLGLKIGFEKASDFFDVFQR